MAFHKRTVAFIAINCLLLATAVQGQQHDDKQDLRAKLFNQVLTDFKDLRECMEQEEGGLRKSLKSLSTWLKSFVRSSCLSSCCCAFTTTLKSKHRIAMKAFALLRNVIVVTRSSNA